MDIVDQELAEAERDASPQRYQRRRSDEIERVLTASSASTSSSATSRADTTVSDAYRRSMSRVSTGQDLERHPTELSRIATHRAQHGSTVGASIGSRTASRSSLPLPAFGAGKPYPPQLPAQEEYVVEFDGPNDPMHAQNWPFPKKFGTSVMLAFTTLTASFASSIYSAGSSMIAEEFHVGTEIGVLGTSLYVLGFSTGPTLWAPLSELKGRKLPICLSIFGFSVFSIATAVAKDIQTVMLGRFFSGFCGACPLAVVAAVFSDMFDNRTRGVAITIFSACVFSAPLLAPSVGGFIAESYLGWRWTEYIPAFMGFFAFTVDFLFMNETYPPVILVEKAAELRRRTRNWGIHAKQEEIEVDFRELITKNFSRPMKILFTEPIVLLITIYMSFIYGLLYLSLGSYPLVFQGVHGFNAGQSGLTFYGMVIGQIIAGISVLAQQPWYLRKLDANNGVSIPEWRLPSAMVGGITFALGLFWFGWTGYTKSISWVAPACSGLFTGFGLMAIMLQSMNYLVDAYLMFAASALAGNTFLRSLAGAGFPLFTRQMFNGMGIQYAGTLLGCVALVLAPIPFVFYFYGAKIREKSKYAATFDVSTTMAEKGSDTGTEGDCPAGASNGGLLGQEFDPDVARRASAAVKEGDVEKGRPAV